MSFLIRAKNFWRSVAPVLRRTLYISWSIGVVLLFLGNLGDAADFWKDRGFATNVASSVTTALFGIPLALIFLQHLSGIQASLARQRNAMDLTNQIIGEMNTLSAKLWPGGESTLTSLQKEARECQTITEICLL